MAGHSKWQNIKHKKARQDAKRGKIFDKLAKEIMVAAKEGGGDQDKNFRLRMAIEKAKENNVPNDNIDRAVKKGTGELKGASSFEEVTYEGYGPGGVAVFLEAMTDNKNRTAPEIRHLFTKYGGNLGEDGCVAWMFDRKGLITIDTHKNDITEEDLMVAIEAGAEDFKRDGDIYEIITEPQDFEDVKNAITEYGIDPSYKSVTMLPSTLVTLTGDEAKKMIDLMTELEDHDDVQNVYSNFDIADDELIS